MTKYKVGDRVVMVEVPGASQVEGKIGTILQIEGKYSIKEHYGVKGDEDKTSGIWWCSEVKHFIPHRGRPKNSLNSGQPVSLSEKSESEKFDRLIEVQANPKTIEIPKCPKTVTGNHNFMLRLSDKYWKCEYCGIIDDRPIEAVKGEDD